METKRRRLLLADDSLTIQKVVSLTFSDEGMEVVSVGAGDEAIRHLEESDGLPDIVLADVHMPGLTGYEVCERIKQDVRWRHLPVVLLAGAFEPFNVAEARRVGADEVLSKPFQSIRELIGKVGSLLGGKADAAQDQEAPRRAADPAPPSPRAESSDSSPVMQPQAAAHEAPAEAAAPPYVHTEPYADLGADDEMIEATPAERFAAHGEASRADAPEYVVAETGIEPFGAVDAEAAGVAEDSSSADEATDGADDYVGAGDFYGTQKKADAWAGERLEAAQAYAGAIREEVRAEAHAGRAAFAAHAAGAAAADDALLEIGSVELPQAGAESDDFVLDIDFDEPAPSAARSRDEAHVSWGEPAARRESPTPPEPDAAGAFAEAAHGEAEQSVWQETIPTREAFDAWQAPAPEESNAGEVQSGHWSEASAPRHFVEPQVVASDEPVSMAEDLSVEGDVARPPLGALEVSAAHEAPAPSSSSSASPEQLSPEMIDRIARRVVELMSERAVQEVAWEVVPALAERLIRQRLDEKQ